MVIDTSALMAILQHEPEAEVFAYVISCDNTRFISAVSCVELIAVISSRQGLEGKKDALNLLKHMKIQEQVFTLEHMQLAQEAWLNFGKGRHPARLNMGDCCSYALAKATKEPLLFKGDDFGKTDLLLVDWQTSI